MSNEIIKLSENIRQDVNLPLSLRNLIIQQIDKTNIVTRKNVLIKAHQSRLTPIPHNYYKPVSKCFKIEV